MNQIRVSVGKDPRNRGFEVLVIDLGGFDRYIFDYIGILGDHRKCHISLILNGRGERIRTSDPLVPNQVRYQTALRPELCCHEPLMMPSATSDGQSATNRGRVDAGVWDAIRGPRGAQDRRASISSLAEIPREACGRRLKPAPSLYLLCVLRHG